jgi:hypothetical protein
MPSATQRFLSSGRPPALKFSRPGDRAGGIIVKVPVEAPVREFKTRQPERWPDGTEKTQLYVIVRNGDSLAGLYVKPAAMREALQKALNQAEVDDLDIGGKLWFTYTGDGPATGELNPPKEYHAEYIASPRQRQLSFGDEAPPDEAPPL